MTRIPRRFPLALALLLATALPARGQGAPDPGTDGLPTAIHQTLPNGMRLVMIEDHAAPLVSECLWIGVGAVDETGPTSGLSHLLEHLLFDGTETRTREEIQREFDRLGAYVNAFTRNEYTAHVLSAPRETFLDALEMQADMILRSTLPEEEVSKERNVVLEEMKRDRDDPRGYSRELFERELFRGTPLTLPVIGTEPTVRTVPREEILDFYRRHYTPDRMTAIVLGDFDPREVRDRVETLYGEAIPRYETSGPAGRTRPPDALPIEPRRRDEWLPTGSAYVRFGLPAPAAGDAQMPALELATRLLLDGEAAPLRRALTEGDAPLATSLDGGLVVYEVGSAWTLEIATDDPANADVIEAAVVETLRRFASQGPELGELGRAKVAYRVNDAFATENVLYFGMELCDWVARGGYEARRRYLNDIQRATAADVRDAVARWLVPVEGSRVDGLVHVTHPFQETESAQPSSAATRTLRRTLPNGLRLVARENPASRVTAVHALVEHRVELEPPGLAGIGNFTAEMLAAGTRNHDAAAISAEMESMGARFSVAENPMIPYDDYYWSPDYAFLRMEVVNAFAGRAVDLVNELLREPIFPEKEIGATRERLLAVVAEEERSASQVSDVLVREALFGADSPWANPIRGTAESLERISRRELLAYHKLAYAPNNLIITVAGGMRAEEALDRLERAWLDAQPVEAALPERPSPEGVNPGPTRLAREMDRDQSQLALAHRTPGFAHPDMPALSLFASVLSRRLGLDLREQRGLAYRVGAGIDFTGDFGWLSLIMGTRAENVAEALAGMQEIMQTMRRDLVDPEELDLVRNAALARRVRYRQRHIGQAYYLGLYDYLGRAELMELEADLFRAVTPEDLRRAAREHLGPDDWVTVIVGREAQAQLEARAGLGE